MQFAEWFTKIDIYYSGVMNLPASTGG